MLKAYDIIKTLVQTEKSSQQIDSFNQYVFKVDRKANKIEILQAITAIFGVTPIAVKTMNYKGKKKKYRMRKEGRRAHWKKAVVTLKDGDGIGVS